MLEPLRAGIESQIRSSCSDACHRDAILRTLALPGYALHPEGSCLAGKFALSIYQSIQGSADTRAYQAAVAVELLMEAAHLFDDVGDMEIPPGSEFSPPEVLAIAITLLNCGAAAAIDATRTSNHSASSICSLSEFHLNYISACGGQFLDSYWARRSQATLDDSIAMTSQKSGSLGKFAAAFAAGCATDDQLTINTCGELGFNLFTYLQIADDLRDACPEEEPRQDLIQNKKTAPLMYFYRYLSKRHPLLEASMMTNQSWNDVLPDIVQEYSASGASLFGAILAETFLNRAKDNLVFLKNRVLMVQELEQILAAVELYPQDSLSVV